MQMATTRRFGKFQVITCFLAFPPGRGFSRKLFYVEASPCGPTPYSVENHFDRNGLLLSYPSHWKKVPLSHTYLTTLHPFPKILRMKLTNNITGKHQALPEEMLTKNHKYYLFISYSDFPTLSNTSTCEIPTPKAWEKYAFRERPPSIGHCREHLYFPLELLASLPLLSLLYL